MPFGQPSLRPAADGRDVALEAGGIEADGAAVTAAFAELGAALAGGAGDACASLRRHPAGTRSSEIAGSARPTVIGEGV
jgi:hypothetical protein